MISSDCPAATTVLVTGASGFIGRHAVARLAEHGFRIHALSRKPVPHSDVIWHPVDLLDFAATEAAVERSGASHCLHLAWDVGHGYWNAPANLDWVAASLNLMRSFHRHGGRRFVAAGTCAEYDWSNPAPFLSEDGIRAPTTLYGVAKDAVRRMLEGFAASTGMSWAWGVLFLSFGEYERPDRLVPSVVRALLAGREASTTSGIQWRDFLDTRDQGAALAALLVGDVMGVVNVASGQPTTVADVVRIIADVVGRPDLLRVGALPDRPGEPIRLVGDARRLNEEVGFVPERSLTEGLADAVSWWRRHHFSHEPVP